MKLFQSKYHSVDFKLLGELNRVINDVQMKSVKVITVDYYYCFKNKERLLSKTHHNCTTTIKTSLNPCHNGANTHRQINRFLI